MPEDSPPPVVRDAAVSAQEALTAAAIESILGDFRSWLERLVVGDAIWSEARPPVRLGSPLAGDAEPVDLHTMLGQFIALRHEVHLQTKASRAQQTQAEETLGHLGQAVSTAAAAQENADQLAQEAQKQRLRPLLKTLVDVWDSLNLARRELERGHSEIAVALKRLELTGAADPGVPRQAPAKGRVGAWLTWLRRGRSRTRMAVDRCLELVREQEKCARETGSGISQILEALLTGYRMGLQRLERALAQHDLEAIACAGKRFDPDEMEVLETVDGTDRPDGEVVEEVRRGYRWQGKVFRCAQVRVAKTRSEKREVSGA